MGFIWWCKCGALRKYKNPQETEIQNLVDFFFYTMHHICTTQTYNKVLQIALFSKKRLINTLIRVVPITLYPSESDSMIALGDLEFLDTT